MMKNVNGIKIIYWLTTGLLFLFEGVLVAFTSQTDFAKEGISHLGYPEYFGVLLALFKVAGAVVLILPYFSYQVKEWAYAGFTFTLISAFVSHLVIDGFHFQTLMPVFFLAVLALSYFSYQSLKAAYSRSKLIF